MNSDSKKARIVKANRMLQAKVGIGPIDEEKIAHSQELIDNNDVDFKPLAEQYFTELQEAIDRARKNIKDKTQDDSVLIADLIAPVMQVKANASMFNFPLVGSLANIMLNFLETIKKIDKDVLTIVEAHQNTLNLIINNNMKGDGGAFGTELTAELKDACKRYFAKCASAGAAIEDKDAFFID